MTSVTQISRAMKRIMEKEANQIARDVGCVQRQRKFSGATLLQTLVVIYTKVRKVFTRRLGKPLSFARMFCRIVP